MSGFDFDTSHLEHHLNTKERKVIEASKQKMHESVDDLARIATNVAPIKLSRLRKSDNKEVEASPDKVVGEITFSAIEETNKGNFNYALWTHEMDYSLGEQSAASPGTDGYPVGNKYLERPLKGESQKYVRWYAEGISKVMDSS